jgi:hypothetical protein
MSETAIVGVAAAQESAVGDARIQVSLHTISHNSNLKLSNKTNAIDNRFHKSTVSFDRDEQLVGIVSLVGRAAACDALCCGFYSCQQRPAATVRAEEAR